MNPQQMVEVAFGKVDLMFESWVPNCPRKLLLFMNKTELFSRKVAKCVLFTCFMFRHPMTWKKYSICLLSHPNWENIMIIMDDKLFSKFHYWPWTKTRINFMSYYTTCDGPWPKSRKPH